MDAFKPLWTFLQVIVVERNLALDNQIPLQ
jgi:hypothetical protein